ncbi:MAG TPA: hypothetical protein VF169_21790 [Albitalea sp.]|uniref:hypothetical protein n=1 Tax=Piscinibacter sp. TaxID=1903157 RepID=UPI002ED4B817
MTPGTPAKVPSAPELHPADLRRPHSPGSGIVQRQTPEITPAGSDSQVAVSAHQAGPASGEIKRAQEPAASTSATAASDTVAAVQAGRLVSLMVERCSKAFSQPLGPRVAACAAARGVLKTLSEKNRAMKECAAALELMLDPPKSLLRVRRAEQRWSVRLEQAINAIESRLADPVGLAEELKAGMSKTLELARERLLAEPQMPLCDAIHDMVAWAAPAMQGTPEQMVPMIAKLRAPGTDFQVGNPVADECRDLLVNSLERYTTAYSHSSREEPAPFDIDRAFTWIETHMKEPSSSKALKERLIDCRDQSMALLVDAAERSANTALLACENRGDNAKGKGAKALNVALGGDMAKDMKALRAQAAAGKSMLDVVERCDPRQERDKSLTDFMYALNSVNSIYNSVVRANRLAINIIVEAQPSDSGLREPARAHCLWAAEHARSLAASVVKATDEYATLIGDGNEWSVDIERTPGVMDFYAHACDRAPDDFTRVWVEVGEQGDFPAKQKAMDALVELGSALAVMKQSLRCAIALRHRAESRGISEDQRKVADAILDEANRTSRDPLEVLDDVLAEGNRIPQYPQEVLDAITDVFGPLVPRPPTLDSMRERLFGDRPPSEAGSESSEGEPGPAAAALRAYEASVASLKAVVDLALPKGTRAQREADSSR